MADNRATRVRIPYTVDEVLLMRRYLFSADEDPGLLTAADHKIVDEFVTNAYENMLDNAHAVEQAGELLHLPEPPDGA